MKCYFTYGCIPQGELRPVSFFLFETRFFLMNKHINDLYIMNWCLALSWMNFRLKIRSMCVLRAKISEHLYSCSWLHLARGNDHRKGNKGSCSRLDDTPPQTSPTSVLSILNKQPGRLRQGPRKELSLNHGTTEVEL